MLLNGQEIHHWKGLQVMELLAYYLLFSAAVTRFIALKEIQTVNHVGCMIFLRVLEHIQR